MEDLIEFPIFTGVSGDLRPWISWLEAFFVREKFKKLEKMNLAQSLLEGEAEAWFYLIQKTLIFYSWRELKEKLLLRFGDVADSDRIRLIAEQDRFLMEIRDEARIRRRKTTSIPVKDTIRETITVVEETSEIVDGNLAERASEKKLVSPNQVPVSSLEPGLSFSSEIIDVSVAWPSEMVSHNRVHSQAGFECVKNKNNAHHVLDEMLLRQHKFQQRKKPSLSPKSRMFKFKNRTKLSNWSQMDLHQVIDISKVNNLSPCVSANFGLVRKTRTFQCLRFKKQAHMSRVLYQLRMLHDPGGMKQLLPSDMKSMFGRDVHTMLLEKQDAHVDSLIVRINVILSCGVALGKQIQWAEIQKLSLYKEFWIEIMDEDITKLLNSNGGKLQLYGSVLEVTFVRRLRVNQQHQKSKSTKSWRFKYKGSLRNTRSESREMKQFVGFMQFQLKHKWRSKHLHTISAWEFYLSSVFSTVTSANSCSGYKRMLEQLQVHTILIVHDVKSQVKHIWRLVWRLWKLHNQWFVLVILQLLEPYGWSGARGLGQLILDDLKSHMRHKWKSKHLRAVFGPQNNPSDALDVVTTAAIFQLVPDRSVSHDCFLGSLWEKKIASLLDVVCVLPECMVHKSFALWHRWRRKASICILPLQFSFFKLEDKLVFRGESIDTFHQAYIESRGEDLARGLDDVAEVVTQTEDAN